MPEILKKLHDAENTIQQLQNELTETQHGLVSLTLELESRVEHRTAELNHVNKELEAFSYSVSHDLISHLSLIKGFSQVLIDDYAHQLDEKGKNYLERIIHQTISMHELIDALLKLSRINQFELHIETVNLSIIAQNILSEFQEKEPKRSVKFSIAPDILADADRKLITIVMENLLGNAWKFSNTKPTSHITFDISQIEGTKAYFVQDNGVGFDMQHADQLFTPFRRLHSSHEFPGTGIGLSTVERIIHRHGGHIWADSKPNEYTQFFFTLPELTD